MCAKDNAHERLREEKKKSDKRIRTRRPKQQWPWPQQAVTPVGRCLGEKVEETQKKKKKQKKIRDRNVYFQPEKFENKEKRQEKQNKEEIGDKHMTRIQKEGIDRLQTNQLNEKNPQKRIEEEEEEKKEKKRRQKKRNTHGEGGESAYPQPQTQCFALVSLISHWDHNE
jgi:hypothetical protein